MSLPTNFFIGRGGGVSAIYTFLVTGGGGGWGTNEGTGGPGGVSMFTLEIPQGALIQTRAGGFGINQSRHGGGGGFSNVTIPSLGFQLHVGGGGGSGYSDMGGWGGGAGYNGSAGLDYQGTSNATYSSDLHDGNTGSGGGGTQSRGGYGGVLSNDPGTAGSQGGGGVYAGPDVYKGGGGGGGWYGGGSGCGNNGWGGGPGGGGSGEVTVGNAAYTALLNTTNAHPLQGTDAQPIYAQNISMAITSGSCTFTHPHNFNTGQTYLLNGQHGQIASTDSRFSGFVNAGAGGRMVTNSTAQGGVVVIFKEGENTPLFVSQGTQGNINGTSAGDTVSSVNAA